MPIFDQFDVDLVINGHNHLYERVYPMRNNVVQAHVPPDGTIAPATQGAVGPAKVPVFAPERP
jgi:hypothetical protein